MPTARTCPAGAQRIYRISRLETDCVTYCVPAASVEEAIHALKCWSEGDPDPTIREVGRSFADVEEEDRWEVMEDPT